MSIGKFYIAAPFFNDQQREIVELIEKLFDEYDIKYFSPRSEGVLIDLKPEERESHLQRIYDSNIYNIEDCENMIAVVDGRDIGTVFEIGYFTALKNEQSLERKLITFTNENFGLNVMIQKSVDAHAFGIDSLEDLIRMCKYNMKMTDNELSFFKNFNERVY